jgi:HD superfamily phosphodiesterase
MSILSENLKEKNPTLFYEFERVRKMAEGGVLDYQTVYGDTINGLKHVEDVENKLGLLIPHEIKEQLNDFDLYLLLSAVYLHDIGKVKRDYYSHHSEISLEIINEHYPMLRIDNEHVATMIAWIAYGRQYQCFT